MSNKPSYKRPNVDMKRYRDFRVKISQIPPMDLAFQNMAINEYELLVATIYRLNDLIEVHNTYTEKIDEVLEWLINDGLGLAVIEQLNVWLNDGTLEVLINETLFNMKLDKSEFEDYKLVVNQTLQDLNQSIQSFIGGEISRIDGELEDLETNKADKVYVDGELNKKSDKDLNPKINEFMKFNGHPFNFMHRGFSGAYPENSYLSFEKAGQHGAKGVELDVYPTSDGDFIVIHDETVNRTTDGSGNVQSKTMSQLRELKITGGTNAHLMSETYGLGNAQLNIWQKLPTLEEVMDIALTYQMKMLIELKGTWSDLNLENLYRLIQEKNMLNGVAVMSFNLGAIQRMRTISDDILLGWVNNNINESILNTVSDINECLLSVAHGNIDLSPSNSLIKLAKQKRIPLTVWTVNNRNIMKNAFRCGFGVTTDKYPNLRSKISFVTGHINKPTNSDFASENVKMRFQYLQGELFKISVDPSNHTLQISPPLDSDGTISARVWTSASSPMLDVKARSETNERTIIEFFDVASGDKLTSQQLKDMNIWITVEMRVRY